MRRLALTLTLALLLPGCGGDGGTSPTSVAPPPTPAPTPAPTPTPTPTPDPVTDYSGNYSGSMIFSVQGGPEFPMQVHTEVTQDGNSLNLGALEVPGFGEFPLKGATLVSKNEFVGSAGYQSIGCGRVKVSTQGSFTGPKMALNAGLTSDCFHARFRGELSK
jgi:hypothetical protein